MRDRKHRATFTRSKVDKSIPGTVADRKGTHEEAKTQNLPRVQGVKFRSRTVDRNLDRTHIEQLKQSINDNEFHVDNNPLNLLPEGGKGLGKMAKDARKETQALKDAWKETQTFLTKKFQTLSKGEQRKLAIRLEQFVPRLREQFGIQSSPVDPLPEPDESGKNYPRYPGYRKADPYKWLGEYWGRWLKHFTPEFDRNYLFLNQLQKLDERLYNALRNHREWIEQTYNVELKDVIPPHSLRIKQDLVDLGSPDVKKLRRLEQYLRRKQANLA